MLFRGNYQRQVQRRGPCKYCGKSHDRRQKCKILCHYCHEIHLRSDMVDGMCPHLAIFAKKLQQNTSYLCRVCDGQGAFQKQIQTTYWQTKKHFEARVKKWQEMKEEGTQAPQRKVIKKQADSQIMECQQCSGKGKVHRVMICCQQGCRKCNFQGFIVNPTWIKYRMQTKSNQQTFNCSVCLQEVGPGQQAFELGCKHKFHAACIHTWLKINDRCPICRQVDHFVDINLLKIQEERPQPSQSLFQNRPFGPLGLLSQSVNNIRGFHSNFQQQQQWNQPNINVIQPRNILQHNPRQNSLSFEAALVSSVSQQEDYNWNDINQRDG